MKLSLLFENAPDIEIGGLCTDSRKIQPMDMYFCMDGMTFDGHQFVEEVVEKGAVEHVVNLIHFEYGTRASLDMGRVLREMHVILSGEHVPAALTVRAVVAPGVFQIEWLPFPLVIKGNHVPQNSLSRPVKQLHRNLSFLNGIFS